MNLTPGTRLGPYEIVSALGAGGMGEVYRARDTRLGRDVALKLLPAAFERDPERLARFEREARAVAGISHPNIVVLHSIEEEGGRRFITMEVVEGESLDRAMTPGGLPLPRVLELAVALSGALVAAHEKGVVHRDLKPANVMLTREGRLKVLDFGLAKMAGPQATLDLSAAPTMDSPVSSMGQVVGTVPYMAPEQLRGEPADARTDLFAFGVVLYELAAGRRPFAGESAADVSSAILRDAPTPLSSLRPGLPPELEQIVRRCLEKDPRARIQTALELNNDLRRIRRALEQSGTALPAKPAAEPPSIAVLPFVNMSRDEENEYFSDGLAEELLNVLSKIRGLRVAARSSSFTFKGKGATVAEVGKALGVATVLEGSVRKAGNRIRISVQLVKVEDGFHVWSETYDRTLDDIFAVQDDIAQAVVKELRTTLLGAAADSNASGEARAEVAAAAKGRATSGESHRLFLQGLYLVNRLTPRDLEQGVAYLHKAVEEDPANARAWATLAWSECIRGNMGTDSVEQAYSRAREACRRALELEPDLSEAHMALGSIQCWSDWDWPAADASFRRALQLAPGNADVLRSAAMLCYGRGNLDEALGLILEAVEQDPLAPVGHHCAGRIHRVRGRYREAEAAFRKALDIAPGGFANAALLAMVLAEQGRTDEAIELAGEEPADWARLFALAVVHHQAGHPEESDRALRELTEKRGTDAGFQIAAVHAVRGEADEAFRWLQRAYDQRDSGLTLLKNEPLFRPLHADPRWNAFLAKMRLAD